MEEILANWNPQEHNGMRRPKLLYTVPVCQVSSLSRFTRFRPDQSTQNPTGAVSFLHSLAIVGTHEAARQ